MRGIDADEAKEKMKDMAAYSTHGCLLYLSDVLHKIDECQILDVQSLVHAHWIKSNYDNVDGTIYKCSNCNAELFSAWNYCPNCGAKMDEEER